VKVTKNPGHVSIVPSSNQFSIPLSTHMLISHGKLTIEMRMEDEDSPIIMTQNCPRLNVCQVISGQLCLDKWVNVACYDYVNWSLVAVAVVNTGFLIILIRFALAVILLSGQ